MLASVAREFLAGVPAHWPMVLALAGALGLLAWELWEMWKEVIT